MELEVDRNYFENLLLVGRDEDHLVVSDAGKQGRYLRRGSRNMVGCLRKGAQEDHPSF